MDNGADIYHKSVHGDDALILASKLCHRMIIELLIERGANIEVRTNSGNTFIDCIRDANVKKKTKDFIEEFRTRNIKGASR